MRAAHDSEQNKNFILETTHYTIEENLILYFKVGALILIELAEHLNKMTQIQTK